jgi:hypothetical protein
LLLPQATRSPRTARDTQRPAIAECLDIFRPAKPTMTMPASGNVNGSHGERFSALGCWGLTVPEFGPAVLMVRVTVWGDVAPWAIVLKAQLTVVSRRPLQAKVTAAAKVVAPPVAVTVKVEVVDCPESAVAGVVGVDKVKVGAVTVTITGAEVEFAFVPVYFPMMEFVPTGRAVVVKVPVPPDTVAVPRTVVEPLS